MTGKKMSARERSIKEGLNSTEIELNGASTKLKELGFCRLSNEIELIKEKVQSIRINPDDLTVKRLQAKTEREAALETIVEKAFKAGCSIGYSPNYDIDKTQDQWETFKKYHMMNIHGHQT